MLLLCNSHPWEKNCGASYFNVLIGCSDGAEAWKLVEIFILIKWSSIIVKHSIVLYSDDGLGIFEKLSLSQVE